MPIPVVSIAQMREWEKATWAQGQTEAEVIRRAGAAVGRLAQQLTAAQDRIIILAGKGNNGEDARAARPKLVERVVEEIHVTDPARDFQKLDVALSSRCSLLIDGLFGIGLNRPLDAPWVRLINRINEANIRVLAVDVPSGLNGDTGESHGATVQAEVTLCIGSPKLGLLLEPAWPFVGRLEVAPEIGLLGQPPRGELQWTLPGDFENFPPRRGAATHKGTYGHLAMVAGSLGFHGASVLAARGAQRAQPGLVTLFPQENVYDVTASQLQAVMVSPYQGASTLSGAWTAAVLGPGLAAADLPAELKSLAKNLWREADFPVVVDASGLEWLPSGPLKTKAARVITPHPGEAARLLGSAAKIVQTNRVKSLREISARFGDCWVVLKGHQTLVGRSTGDVYVNSSGNPHLAQGGSGDVLAGYLSGLLAQPALQAEPLTTIRYAVWRHGAAADVLQSARPNWVVEDLVAAIGS